MWITSELPVIRPECLIISGVVGKPVGRGLDRVFAFGKGSAEIGHCRQQENAQT